MNFFDIVMKIENIIEKYIFNKNNTLNERIIETKYILSYDEY